MSNQISNWIKNHQKLVYKILIFFCLTLVACTIIIFITKKNSGTKNDSKDLSKLSQISECTDKIKNCSTLQQYCSDPMVTGFMKTYCGKTCKFCGTDTVSSTCVDKKTVDCPIWATQGYCLTHAEWMKENCTLSCKKCTNSGTGTCIDTDTVNCPVWASSGECTKNPGWMQKNCKKSCKVCGSGTGSGSGSGSGSVTNSYTCIDTDTVNCPVWASSGECDKNPGWMQKNCKKSCKVCWWMIATHKELNSNSMLSLKGDLKEFDGNYVPIIIAVGDLGMLMGMVKQEIADNTTMTDSINNNNKERVLIHPKFKKGIDGLNFSLIPIGSLLVAMHVDLSGSVEYKFATIKSHNARSDKEPDIDLLVEKSVSKNQSFDITLKSKQFKVTWTSR